MGLCSALSWPPTLPLVIKMLLFVCTLFFISFQVEGFFWCIFLVGFVWAATTAREESQVKLRNGNKGDFKGLSPASVSTHSE